MKAMLLKENSLVENHPLEMVDLPIPSPGPKDILIQVYSCGVCHTEIDEIEGRVKPKLPIVLGHEIIGRVVQRGSEAKRFKIGDRVGIAWIYSSCGDCQFCRNGNENLCYKFRATGCHENGGYAEYTKVSEDFAYPIPDRFTDPQAAPLLCAGAIGYRNLRLSGIEKGKTLGLFGFGASAHIVIQLAVYWGCEVFVFTRSEEHRRLAKRYGASWVGGPDDTPPKKLQCAIDFTPIGETIPKALKHLEKAGRLVLAVIRKRTLIPAMDYTELLWEEKEIKSVANITRKDAQEFLTIASQIPIIPEIEEFRLEEANKVLNLLKQGRIQGAAVLRLYE